MVAPSGHALERGRRGVIAEIGAHVDRLNVVLIGLGASTNEARQQRITVPQ